jgi:ATP-dependent helicase Lhr and Lhr-like helicase
MLPDQSQGYNVIRQWLNDQQRQPFAFQEQTWEHISAGHSGLVNAPTGFGKTYSVFLGCLIKYMDEHPDDYTRKAPGHLQMLWISPLRALAKDLGRAMEEALAQLGIPWSVGIRNGDTDPAERARQKRHLPEILVITPESLHLMLAQKGYPAIFESLWLVAIDEWHELLGSKRGVQVELALSRLRGLKAISGAAPTKANEDATSNAGGSKPLQIWGISATIGNLQEATEVLLPTETDPIIVRADLHKKVKVISVIPDEIEKYPWAGHLGIKMVDKVLPIVEASDTTLIFINTRGMSERWYQVLLEVNPDLAGVLALHHGSIEQELRNWVEESLHTGRLKAVVTTASLDLGVDFRPVDTVIQVGSPKGVARFLQRAGRSGHQPGATSLIYFLPTHSLELVEAAALKEAIAETYVESRDPMLLCFDVLIQYLCTLAIGEGFLPNNIFEEVRQTFGYKEITREEFNQLLRFITVGGQALHQYDEFHKVIIDPQGVYRITSRKIAMRHRLHIGTIVSDAMLKVRFVSGGYVGVIEEYFISRLNPGDVFTLAGRVLEFVMIKDMAVIVRKSNAKKALVPSWNGGRMPLSANLGVKLRKKFQEAGNRTRNPNETYPPSPELEALKPLFDLQAQLSHIPMDNELLIEQIETKDGYHLFVFPFEGRLVHQAMSALLAYRIARITPITFSIAMNDYGFELLSDQPIPLDDTNAYELFSMDNLMTDISISVNAVEMARRKFRDIAVIGGLIFQGYPGEYKKARHLQSSAGLLFNVFSEYDPDNLLLRQAYQEIMDQEMQESRLRAALQRIASSRIVVTFPDRLTPFCFPIKVDSMRENLTSEKLEDRVLRMQMQLEK